MAPSNRIDAKLQVDTQGCGLVEDVAELRRDLE
jgi:hypothetical protein